ncbi:MAG: YfiR family protein [Ferruginibacter sp.]
MRFFYQEKNIIRRLFLIIGRHKAGFIICLFLVSAIPTAFAQQETNYAVKANIIYHFTKYIDWPSDKKSGDFIIGVIGNTALYNELKKNIANKMVVNQKIVIKKFSALAAGLNCQVLFIGDDESDNIKKIVSATTGSATLLISESDGLAKRGSCINFVIVADHLKLEINKDNIEERGLSIASELLQLGKIIK